MNNTKKQIKLLETQSELKKANIALYESMSTGAKYFRDSDLWTKLRASQNMAEYEQDCLYRTLHALDGIEDKHVYPTDKEIEEDFADTDDLAWGLTGRMGHPRT